MNNILIITPYYPFPKKIELKQDTKAVYYLCKKKSKDENLIILYYYQSTRFDAIKSLFKTRRFESISDLIYKDDIGNDILFFEHPCIIPSRTKTIGYFDNKLLKQLSRYLENKQIDLDTVVVHFPSRFSELAGKIPSKKKIAIVHSFDVKSKKNREAFIDKLGIFDKLGFRSLNIEEDFKKNIVSNKKSFLCLSGVPDNYTAKSNACKKWKKNGKLNLIFAGRLDANKNVIQIIKALNIAKEHFDFHFTIIGDGDCRLELENEIKKSNLTERVKLVGKLDRSNVFEYMLKSDVFIMTSFKETLGISYLEALAAGNIILGSENQGIFGLFDEKAGCYFANPYDCKSIADQLFKINSLQHEIIEKKRKVGFAAISRLTESSVSRMYLDEITEKNKKSIF